MKERFFIDTVLENEGRVERYKGEKGREILSELLG